MVKKRAVLKKRKNAPSTRLTSMGHQFNKPKFRKKDVKIAIELSGGVLNDAAKKLHVTYPTMINYVKRYPSLKRVLENSRNGRKEWRLDVAEAKLDERIGKGDTASLIFFLKTIGRDRGYIERPNPQDIDAGQSVQITIKPAAGAFSPKEMKQIESPVIDVTPIKVKEKRKGKKDVVETKPEDRGKIKGADQAGSPAP